MIQLTNDYESLVFNGDIGRVTAVRPGRGARFTVCFDQREALTRGSSDEAAGAKPNPSPSPDPDPNPNPNPSPNPNPNPNPNPTPNPNPKQRRFSCWLGGSLFSTIPSGEAR